MSRQFGAMLLFAFTVQLKLFRFFLSTVDTRYKVLYNKYLHDANDSATSLADVLMFCDVLSNVKFFSTVISSLVSDNMCDLIVYFALL